MQQLPSTERFSQSTLDGPAIASQALAQRRGWNAGQYHPFSDCMRDTFERNLRARPTIVCLLNRRCPAAILLRVVAVIVASIKGVSWWARPHISLKYREILTPLSRHRNPAPTIALVLRLPWVEASSLRPKPYQVLASGSRAVGEQARRGALTVPAAATRCSPRAQALRGDHAELPAFASAFPREVPTAMWHLFNHGQASEHLTCQINLSCRAGAFISPTPATLTVTTQQVVGDEHDRAATRAQTAHFLWSALHERQFAQRRQSAECLPKNMRQLASRSRHVA